jgi:hypothetical protein
METTETTANFKQYLMRRYGDRSTPKHYLSDLHVFSLHLGAKPILEATKADIDSFVDGQRKRSMAPTTINRPIESISKLLGHAFVTTTQRYTLGADPNLPEAFQVAMAQIDNIAAAQPTDRVTLPHQRSLRQSEHADPAKRSQELRWFDAFPSWLRDELQTYAEMRWYTWKPHMAARYMTRLTCQQFNIWTWLLAYRPLTGWADLMRSDVESWLDARRNAGLSVISCYTELCDLRAFLKSVEDRGRPVNPAVFSKRKQ